MKSCFSQMPIHDNGDGDGDDGDGDGDDWQQEDNVDINLVFFCCFVTFLSSFT